MVDKFKVVVPGAAFRVGSRERVIWASYGEIHKLAVETVGRDMAFSIFISRVARELRRELGTDGARAAFIELARTMPEASIFDRDEDAND